ncbi:uncharacterized protein LOC109713269 [Ananas comosus]|uniref:Uncharacterized protein LOC109713269 n=1 Tax=Ananas comosus TaxID=4615 RepID=A0A6P5FI50_ANACO|nr:uncharacterized protein LOC109713269 [Ananas comosus]
MANANAASDSDQRGPFSGTKRRGLFSGATAAAAADSDRRRKKVRGLDGRDPPRINGPPLLPISPPTPPIEAEAAAPYVASGSDELTQDSDLFGSVVGELMNPKRNMEIKMSKKIGLVKVPNSVRGLLMTGILEGSPVRYIVSDSSQPVLHGVIKGTKILCFCSSCNGSKAISAHNFQQHAGSTKKHFADFICLENGNSLSDVLQACKSVPLDMLEEAIRNAIGPVTAKKPTTCQECKESFLTSRAGKFASLCDLCFDSQQSQYAPSSLHARLPKKPKLSDSTSQTASSSKKKCITGRLTKKDLGLHKLIFKNEILPEGTEVAYYVAGKRILDGYIKNHGIYCLCCNKVVSASQFEAHAGHAPRRKPYNNIYTSNGVSLHEISVSLSKERKLSTSESDDLCRICADGGDLLLCDLCPRAFHKECIGLSTVPEGDWYCQYCRNLHEREKHLAYNYNARAAGRVDGVDAIEQIFKRCIRIAVISDTDHSVCVLCKSHDFSKSTFDDHTVLICDQCEKEYHVGCLRDRNMADLKELPEGEWFCCADCGRVHSELREVLRREAEPLPCSEAEVIRKKRAQRGLNNDVNDEIKWRLIAGRNATEDSKSLLSGADTIFRECFDPIVDPATGADLIPPMVYGQNVRYQDFSRMLCAVLTEGSSVVSAGLLRVLGGEVAELPIVATRRDTQGLGYFQALFSCIEKLLVSLKVKIFVLPAADDVESMWTTKFGFTKITSDELEKYLNGASATVFEGTSTLFKQLPLS